MNQTKVPENRTYKVALILLLGLTAFSTTVRELNRLQNVVSSVQEFTRQLRGTDVVTLNEKPVSSQQPISDNHSCPQDNPNLITSSAESGLSDLMAAASDGYVDSMDYAILTEPELGAKVDLIAGKGPSRHVRQLPRAKSAPAVKLQEDVVSIRRHGDWPARFEFRAPDRRVTLELPMTMVTDIKEDAFDNEVAPDFLLGLLGKFDRKQSHSKAETRKREFMFKRFERSISSRRSS